MNLGALLRDDSGTVVTEYALILAIVGVAVLAGMYAACDTANNSVNGTFNPASSTSLTQFQLSPP